MVYSSNVYVLKPKTNNKVTNSTEEPPVKASPASDNMRKSEFYTPRCNQAILSMGQAQINRYNSIKYDITPDEYVNKLIQQGEIPTKDFNITHDERSDKKYAYMVVSESNKDGQKTKEAVFITDNPANPKYKLGDIKLYNADTGLPYKRIAYSNNYDGSYMVSNYDSHTGKELSNVKYPS